MLISIWPGSSSFSTGSTPFGFFDTDIQFQSDADKVAKFCAIRMGYPLVAIELQDENFYTCFEEAVITYGNEIYKYKIRENYLTLEGSSTGSALNNLLVQPNLGNIIRIAEQYGTEAESGGNVTWNTGSVYLTESVQSYDLNKWAVSQGITDGDLEIKQIFYQAPPAIVRYFDPYAGSGAGFQNLMDSFGFGSYSPASNFMLMPIYGDIAKVQAIELNDQIRKSAFTFELTNNNLRIFPIPRQTGGRIWFKYILKSERNNPFRGNSSSGSLVTNISNVPYDNPIYSQINSIGKQWIYSYALALSKELLGYIRGKYQSIPIPNSETTLNHQELVSAAKDEKAALLEQLRLTLETVSRKTQLENQAAEVDYVNKTLSNIPLPIYIG
jgi:hypothetical protein